MKKSIIIGLIFSSCITSLYGQEYKPWNVGLNFTLYNRYIIIAPTLSRSFGEKFEVGAMPILQYSKRDPSDNFYYQQSSFGLNISGRYFLSRGETMDPYVSSIIGFGFSDEDIGFTDPPGNISSSRTNFFDIAIMLGNEVKLGQKGWIFDFNVGLLGTDFYDNWRDFRVTPIYSFGIKKKFEIK